MRGLFFIVFLLVSVSHGAYTVNYKSARLIDSLRVDSLRNAPAIGTDANGKFIKVSGLSVDSTRASHFSDIADSLIGLVDSMDVLKSLIQFAVDSAKSSSYGSIHSHDDDHNLTIVTGTSYTTINSFDKKGDSLGVVVDTANDRLVFLRNGVYLAIGAAYVQVPTANLEFKPVLFLNEEKQDQCHGDEKVTAANSKKRLGVEGIIRVTNAPDTLTMRCRHNAGSNQTVTITYSHLTAFAFSNSDSITYANRAILADSALVVWNAYRLGGQSKTYYDTVNTGRYMDSIAALRTALSQKQDSITDGLSIHYIDGTGALKVMPTALPNPQSVTPGTGLTGSAYDGSTARTWSVTYGSTAGTATQGNDARNSDARQLIGGSAAWDDLTTNTANYGLGPSPTTYYLGVNLTANGSTNYMYQLLGRNSQMYYRTKEAGVWGNYLRLWDSNNLDTSVFAHDGDVMTPAAHTQAFSTITGAQDTVNKKLDKTAFDDSLNANIGTDFYLQMPSGNKLINSEILQTAAEIKFANRDFLFDTDNGNDPVCFSRTGDTVQALRVHATDVDLFLNYVEDAGEAQPGEWHFISTKSGGTSREWLTIGATGAATFNYYLKASIWQDSITPFEFGLINRGTSNFQDQIHGKLGLHDKADSAVTADTIKKSLAISKIVNLQSTLDGKEPTITAGTTAQVWRGNKTWLTLNVAAVAGLQDELNARMLAVAFDDSIPHYISGAAGRLAKFNTANTVGNAPAYINGDTVVYEGKLTSRDNFYSEKDIYSKYDLSIGKTTFESTNAQMRTMQLGGTSKLYGTIDGHAFPTLMIANNWYYDASGVYRRVDADPTTGIVMTVGSGYLHANATGTAGGSFTPNTVFKWGTAGTKTVGNDTITGNDTIGGNLKVGGDIYTTGVQIGAGTVQCDDVDAYFVGVTKVTTDTLEVYSWSSPCTLWNNGSKDIATAYKTTTGNFVKIAIPLLSSPRNTMSSGYPIYLKFDAGYIPSADVFLHKIQVWDTYTTREMRLSFDGISDNSLELAWDGTIGSGVTVYAYVLEYHANF